jgi:hypothetical protein
VIEKTAGRARTLGSTGTFWCQSLDGSQWPRTTAGPSCWGHCRCKRAAGVQPPVLSRTGPAPAGRRPVEHHAWRDIRVRDASHRPDARPAGHPVTIACLENRPRSNQAARACPCRAGCAGQAPPLPATVGSLIDRGACGRAGGLAPLGRDRAAPKGQPSSAVQHHDRLPDYLKRLPCSWHTFLRSQAPSSTGRSRHAVSPARRAHRRPTRHRAPARHRGPS